MSLVRGPQTELAMIVDLQRRVGNLERGNPFQGAMVSTIDANSTTRLQMGQISPGVWGFEIFDSAGNKILQLDDGGLKQYDAGSNLRVQAGHLGDGDYGLQVTDVNGNSQEILPAIEQYVDEMITVSSTTYVDDGGPSVTAVVGASGSVEVSVSAFLATNAADDGVYVGLFVDGSRVWDVLNLDSAGGQATANCATVRTLTGLTAGSHTFELQYKHSSGANSANFSARSLIVRPL